MGLSFDLTVEELPDQILDRAWASHSFMDAGNNIALGYAEADPNAAAISGLMSGTSIDLVSTARWAGIQPVPGSWVINKIMCANGTVFLCGNYRAKWNGEIWRLNNYNLADSLYWDPSHLATGWNEQTNVNLQSNGFLDGFFAACKYEEIDNPRAWHIIPTRSQIELPESAGPATNDPYYTDSEPINQGTNQQGGLMDMCIDQRSYNTFTRSGWEAESPEISGNGFQPLIIQCVGYIPCEGYGTTVHNSTNVTEGYKWSIYANQDFLPIQYSFVVNIFQDQYTGTDSATVLDTINPQYKNSQLGGINSGIGATELVDFYSHWNYNWMIGSSVTTGQNPNILYGYGQPDQCGSSLATQGAFSGSAAGLIQGSFDQQYFSNNSLGIPWSSCAARYGSLQVYPFEQITYRAHQIGIRANFNGTQFYPQPNTASNFTYDNQYPRQASTFPFVPTPMLGQFPIRKPAEMAFSTPNYLACKGRYQNNLTSNWPTTGRCEYNPKPNYWSPLQSEDTPSTAITDGEIWRHGFIPRQLTGITPSYNTSAGASSLFGEAGLYYPTFEINKYEGGYPSVTNPLLLGNAVTSAISYLIITGNCLEDVTVDPVKTLDAKEAGGKPIYSPLCIVANMGQSYASTYAEAAKKGIAAEQPFWLTDSPETSNYSNNQWFKCYTRRNISLEDVNSENACLLTVAPKNSSLDNATFVKPLPIIRADYPATNNQIFNVGLLLQVNELSDGTNEKRAEIYVLQPWLGIDSTTGVPFDSKTIVPYMTWYGYAEAVIGVRASNSTTCIPNVNLPDWATESYKDIALLPSEWIYTKTQGVPLTQAQVARQESCYHTYIEPTLYTYGENTGLGQTMQGYWDSRVVSGLGWKPFDGSPVGTLTGPTVHVQDPGNININVNPVVNGFATIPNNPVWGGVYRLGVPYNGEARKTGSVLEGPDIYDQWDKRYQATLITNPPIPQQYLSIPTTNTTKVGPVVYAANLFTNTAVNGAGFTFDLNINGSEMGLLAVTPTGATLPVGNGRYTTLPTLVDQINQSLNSYRSAGAPWSNPYNRLSNPQGLANISAYQTSDGEAIYIRDLNAVQFHAGDNLVLGSLFIACNNRIDIENAGSEYYPWNCDSTLPYQYLFEVSTGPIGKNHDFNNGQWACAAVVEEPAYNGLNFNIKNYGNQMNNLCPGGASTTRRPVCADFDLDRAQWMFTFADNDKAVSEVGNGFAALSVTPDFSEYLDQTKNFTNIPDFYDIAVNIFGTGATSIFASSLWAARQGSANLDGIMWIGMADYNTTTTYPSATGVQDTSLSYVYANWWCDQLSGYPGGGTSGPYNGDFDGLWIIGQYVPMVPSIPLDFRCYSGNTNYVIKGTTGRKVQVWLNYVLYDEIDSIIAVECQNLGLRVTPENVEWYKRKIMGQSGAEMSLEEVEKWMELQRQQYQGILKERNRGWKMRRRREQAGTHKPSATETLEEQLAGDFYALDEESIEELLPQLNILPPNPDTDQMMDVDAFGNSASGDIQKTEEKRRNSEN